MAHQCHADILNYSGLHEARIEGMAEIVDSEVAQLGALERAQPALSDPRQRLTPHGEDDAVFLGLLGKKPIETVCQGNLAALALDGFGLGNHEKFAVKVHVFPALAEHFASPHPGIEGASDNPSEVIR